MRKDMNIAQGVSESIIRWNGIPVRLNSIWKKNKWNLVLHLNINEKISKRGYETDYM